MKLLGSTTSPFVRRIRLYFQAVDFDFVNLDIFSEEGSRLLTENNPAQKVPALIDNDVCIYDSRIIYRYLVSKLGLQQLTWQQENILTLIDAANDSLVTLLISDRSGFDIAEDKLLFNLQHSSIKRVICELEKEVSNKSFTNWDYPSVCLFCLIDWAMFRQLFDFNEFPDLRAFHKIALLNSGIKETDPR